MWDNILTYRTELPDGFEWEHFGVEHLSYLIGFALATVLMVVLYRRSSETRRRKIRIAYACIVVALEVIKQLICLVKGVYEPGLIPFHLCGMSIVFIAVHTVFPNKTTAELLYSLSLPGAIAALLFSDWNIYPLANFFCQQSFFIHFFEFSFPVLLLSTGELRPRFTQLWRCVVYLLVVVPPIYFFNHAFNTNFFFLNEAAPGSPLSFLQSTLGNPGYIFGFAGLVAAVWCVMYLPWIMKTWWEKSRLSKPTSPGIEKP
ncbi:MAG: TIGR02206 family membrane protein [Coriobacteriales bacterium]|jgi:hypothetical integral membrane protein (TIGR02206 family)|nr:TIGR02206 family membrane protein [Coriobacteriales bacterium]